MVQPQPQWRPPDKDGGNFVRVRTLHKSPNASTYLVRCAKTGGLFVMKRLPLDQGADSDEGEGEDEKEGEEDGEMKGDAEKKKSSNLNEGLNEIEILSGLNHPNIIRYIESFQERGKLCIIMEFAAGGDLHRRIRKQKGFNLPEDTVVIWFLQLCLAMAHLHGRNILHRDLKTKNIFLSAEGNIKLGDFGVSLALKNAEELARTQLGTPYYLSPELCQSQPYDAKSDMWALGCILYEMLCLQRPFRGTNLNELVTKIVKADFDPIPTIYSAELSSLVHRLLTKNPKSRPSIDEVLALPFMKLAASKSAQGRTRNLDRRRTSVSINQTSMLTQMRSRAKTTTLDDLIHGYGDKSKSQNFVGKIDNGLQSTVVAVTPPSPGVVADSEKKQAEGGADKLSVVEGEEDGILRSSTSVSVHSSRSHSPSQGSPLRRATPGGMTPEDLRERRQRRRRMSTPNIEPFRSESPQGVSRDVSLNRIASSEMSPHISPFGSRKSLAMSPARTASPQRVPETISETAPKHFFDFDEDPIDGQREDVVRARKEMSREAGGPINPISKVSPLLKRLELKDGQWVEPSSREWASPSRSRSGGEDESEAEQYASAHSSPTVSLRSTSAVECEVSTREEGGRTDSCMSAPGIVVTEDSPKGDFYVAKAFIQKTRRTERRTEREGDDEVGKVPPGRSGSNSTNASSHKESPYNSGQSDDDARPDGRTLSLPPVRARLLQTHHESGSESEQEKKPPRRSKSLVQSLANRAQMRPKLKAISDVEDGVLTSPLRKESRADSVSEERRPSIQSTPMIAEDLTGYTDADQPMSGATSPGWILRRSDLLSIMPTGSDAGSRRSSNSRVMFVDIPESLSHDHLTLKFHLDRIEYDFREVQKSLVVESDTVKLSLVLIFLALRTVVALLQLQMSALSPILADLPLLLVSGLGLLEVTRHEERWLRHRSHFLSFGLAVMAVVQMWRVYQDPESTLRLFELIAGLIVVQPLCGARWFEAAMIGFGLCLLFIVFYASLGLPSRHPVHEGMIAAAVVGMMLTYALEREKRKYFALTKEERRRGSHSPSTMQSIATALEQHKNAS